MRNHTGYFALSHGDDVSRELHRPNKPQPAAFIYLSPDTNVAAIANSQLEAVREAIAEFDQLFPKLRIIPHAITFLAILPLWIVERRLEELGIRFTPTVVYRPPPIGTERFNKRVDDKPRRELEKSSRGVVDKKSAVR